jgi:hypothetical protein
MKLPNDKCADRTFTLRKVWHKDLTVWNSSRRQINTIPNMEGKCLLVCCVVPCITVSRNVFDILVKQICILDEPVDPNAPCFH